MPLVNYCKKCQTEVPLGESCPYCGHKLTQTGEQLSFGLSRRVVTDWFAWNGLLRIALPVFALAFGVIVGAEALATGSQGVAALLSQGLTETMLGLLALALGCMLVLFWLQGIENVHVVMDRQGVHVRTYIAEGNLVGLYARFAGEETVRRLMQTDDRPPLEGLVLVRRVTLLWSEIRRVRIWREGSTLLFFRPSFWQAAAVCCPVEELAEAEAFVRKKLKRYKKTKVQPVEKAEKKKKG